MKAGLLSERSSDEDEDAEHEGGRQRVQTGRGRCRRWKKKSLQKVKSDQAEGCTIVQGMKALD